MVLDTKNMLHIFPMRLSVMKILIMYWVLVSKEIQHHSFMKSSTFLVCTSPNPGKPRWLDLYWTLLDL